MALLQKLVRFFKPLVALCLVLSPGGCKPAAGPPVPHEKPAKVAHPVAETSLNTIELTPAAVKRLDIATQVVKSQMMQRLRPYGAEVVLPSGASVIVSSPVAGTIRAPDGKHFPSVGDMVVSNQTLLELVPLLSPERAVLTPAERIRFAEARNSLAQSRIDAEGQVHQAKVQLEAAQIAFERADRLFRDKVGTKRAVDDAQAQRLLAQKGLDAAMARQKLVEQIDLESSEAGTIVPLNIIASLAGQIRTMLVRPGEIVAAGVPLFEVMNSDSLWIRVPVYAGEVNEIEATAAITLQTLDGRHDGAALNATPVDLPPSASPLSSAVDLFYRFDNRKGVLRPGERLTALLPLHQSGERLVLPWSAVIHDIYGGQWVYEQLQPGTYVRRRVEVAWVDKGMAVLERGLAAGTEVVTAGAAELAGAEFGFSK